jgi:hypothetical protein
MGFYRSKQIEPLVAEILDRRDNVAFTWDNQRRLIESPDDDDFAIARVIEFSLIEGSRHEGDRHGVFLLSRKDDSRTFTLDAPIQHRGGTAWTMHQRYTSLDRLARVHRPTDLASIAWELQREFGQSITTDWFGYGSFKHLLRASVPAARISATPPSFVIPEGYEFHEERTPRKDVPLVATVLKGIDRSFPLYHPSDWPDYFAYLSRALTAVATGTWAADARTMNQLTRSARDAAALDQRRLARSGFSYIATALQIARRLAPDLSPEEVAETFADISLHRAREAVRLSPQQEAEFKEWLGIRASTVA